MGEGEGDSCIVLERRRREALRLRGGLTLSPNRRAILSRSGIGMLFRGFEEPLMKVGTSVTSLLTEETVEEERYCR